MTPTCNTCGTKFPGKERCKTCGADPNDSPNIEMKIRLDMATIRTKVRVNTPQTRRWLRARARSMRSTSHKSRHGAHRG